MNKTLSKVFLGLVIIIAISYLLQERANNPKACANIKGFWNEADQACEKTTEQIIFQSLSKPHPVSIVYPESEHLVLLNTLEQIDQNLYLRGQFDILLASAQGEMAPIYDQGVIYLNMSKLKVLTEYRRDITYFAAPFVVNTNGSGMFSYVGLFSYNFNNGQARHLDSELLGSRIREENIVIEEKSIVKDNVFLQEGMIQVNFKSHSTQQRVSAYPTQVNISTLQLVGLAPEIDTNARFRRINDCGQVNDCDHSQTKPEL